MKVHHTGAVVKLDKGYPKCDRKSHQTIYQSLPRLVSCREYEFLIQGLG